MFDFGKGISAAATIVCTGLGLAYMAAPGDATEPRVATQVSAPVESVPTEPSIESAAPAAPLVVHFEGSGSLENGEAFALFSFASEGARSVSRVRLRIEPAQGTTVEDVWGSEWTRSGDGAVVEVSPTVVSRGEVIVRLALHGADSGELSSQLSYVDGGSRRSHDGQTHTVRAGATNADALVRVRAADTAQTIKEARTLAASGKHGEAQALLGDARARNAELALTMRRIGELADTQEELARVRDELKPPARRKVRKTPPPSIEFFRGDAS